MNPKKSSPKDDKPKRKAGTYVRKPYKKTEFKKDRPAKKNNPHTKEMMA